MRWYYHVLVDLTVFVTLITTTRVLGWWHIWDEALPYISALLLGIVISYLAIGHMKITRKRRRPLLRIEPWVDTHGEVQEPERRMNPGRW